MKFVTYHYIRDINPASPYADILEKKSFLNQIEKFGDKLSNHFDYNLLEDSSYIPTFDDGFKDHLFAAEELHKNKCVGIFFINSLQYQTNVLLNVHKIHLLLSKINSSYVLEILNKNFFLNKNFTSSLDQDLVEKYIDVYKLQSGNSDKKLIKKLLNYTITPDKRDEIIEFLLNYFELSSNVNNYYLTQKEIKYISDLGMIVGSHTHSHKVLSDLSYNDQYNEIKMNTTFLENIICKKVNIIAYPYGGKDSYNKLTLKALTDLKFKLAFNVDQKDTHHEDFKFNCFEIPRYDCNRF